MSGGIDPSLPQFFLDRRIPQILYLVVRPSRQLRRNLRPPEIFFVGISKQCKEKKEQKKKNKTKHYLLTGCRVLHAVR